MSSKIAVEWLTQMGAQGHIIRTEESTATVALAAQALNVKEQRIAKTLAFDVLGRTVLVVTAGDQKVDNAKYKAFFHTKAKMLKPEETQARTNYAPGGVCPFGVPEDAATYLDLSLQRFDAIYPACGDWYTAARFTPQELAEVTLADEADAGGILLVRGRQRGLRSDAPHLRLG